MSADACRFLLLVLALDDGPRLREVLGGLPGDLLAARDWHVIVVDDGPRAAASAAAREWAADAGTGRLSVLRVPAGLGWGGVQKVAFRHAVDSGFAGVVVLPGDGQYRAADAVRLAERVAAGADVVLGVRAAGPGEGEIPRRWGWPARWVASMQARLAGTPPGDFHAAFRAVSCAFLARVPFEVNSNDAVFDTDLLLQARYVEASVEQVPVAADYARRLRPAGRVPRALASLRAALRYRWHRTGMFCSLRFRHLDRVRYVDKGSVLYSSHAEALRAVRQRAPRTLVDLGCGPGFVAERCEALGVRVTGVDAFDPLPGRMTRFVRADLDAPGLPLDVFSHDMVLFLDVIEHLADPESFLLALRNASASIAGRDPPPLLVLSTPNVAFAAVRLNLLRGSFNYAERGILDVGHKRLFTKATLLRTLDECGYVVDRVVPVGVPFEAVFSGFAARAAGAAARGLARLWPSMFAFQFLVHCRPLPGVRELIRAGSQPSPQPPG